MFSYEEFTLRNLGFVSSEEQSLLRSAKVFIPGIGGMGGIVLSCLARSGVESFIISDPDHFEISNLNRQIFSDLGNIGKSKVQVAAEKILQINPNIKIEIVGVDWPKNLREILSEVSLIVNGCDDILASIQLHRMAKELKLTVVDALPASLPNVYVVQPHSPRPEQTFGYPTQNLGLEMISAELIQKSALCETVYVITHSSSLKHVVLRFAIEMVAGKRKRISHAPMVWMTGVLMSYEAIKVLLNKKTICNHRGVFLNPWEFKYERPLWPPFSWIKSKLVRIFLSKQL